MQGAVVVRDVVLVGGGHSHVAVVKAFAMRPVPGVRVTLVSRDSRTPYSGMLPGLIAGHYSEAEAFIDLVALTQASGVRFIRAEAIGLDPAARSVLLPERPPLSYDVVSLDIGSTPSLAGLAEPGAEVICVKPIDRFLEKWRALEARVARRSDRAERASLERASSSGAAPTGAAGNAVARSDATSAAAAIAVVGGGAGGVELALAAQFRLRRLGASVRFLLVTAEPAILTTHARGVRRRFERVLRERGIDVITNARIVERNIAGLVSDRGRRIAADEVLWVTQAAPAPWLAATSLALDRDGFVSVDAHLQSVSHASVFAAGDIASMQHAPRPKSGVFAVRQGPVLARNLRRTVLEQRLDVYAPQRRFLSLISTGDRYAVASRGAWSAEGGWVWGWKDWVDRRFMRRYQQAEPMAPRSERGLPAVLAREQSGGGQPDAMRCGGCGAKIESGVLAAALDRLRVNVRPDVVGGLQQRDDAALVAVPAGKLAALSVDAFRPLVDDPFLFGEIAANHCLNDLYAVGAEPQAALAIATLPVWPAAKLTDELAQMLAGALAVFARENVQLVGGHTSEGREISLGFSVSGLVSPDRALTKTGLRPGDMLVLTKPLGTGVLFAANMRAQARGEWIDAAVAAMRVSNRRASEILAAAGVHAATDVTGFGLAGHLLEMLRDGDARAEIWPDALPVLAGALDAIAGGSSSTLHPANRDAAAAQIDFGAFAELDRSALLFDPQTAGGLLAGIAARRCGESVDALRRAGYADATIIGRVTAADGGAAIKLRSRPDRAVTELEPRTEACL